ncbi:MAG: hypothetical protein KF760_32295 [Candidatus Eremiobacteraeota bacterium]|nr:hypothetical protein [Candidatus Eremiobacteraeota bacterium]
MFLITILCAGLAWTEPLGMQFSPGRSLGPLRLGQSVKATLAALKAFTHELDDDYAIGPIYQFPAQGTVQLLANFDRKDHLTGLEIHDPSCTLQGFPKVHLGCGREAVVAALGPPDDDDPYYLEYKKLGVRFLFEDGRPPRQQDPYKVPKFKKGQCEMIMLFAPGSER